MPGVEVGRAAVVRRAILDKNVVVAADARIGEDVEADRARGFKISDAGIVVVPKGAVVEA